MIVIKGDAAKRLKQLLGDYRKADSILYENLKKYGDHEGIIKANRQFREAEMRIASLVEIFAQELPDQTLSNE